LSFVILCFEHRSFCAGGKDKRSVEKVSAKKSEKTGAKRQYIQRGYGGQLV